MVSSGTHFALDSGEQRNTTLGEQDMTTSRRELPASDEAEAPSSERSVRMSDGLVPAVWS
jgi:hypothetical protein